MYVPSLREILTLACLVSLKPEDPTVGARTNLLVQFTVENQLPSGGKVLVYLPKWTPYVTTSPESYVEASTSPSLMHCESQANVELVRNGQVINLGMQIC
jgi:hypothetical protein